MEIKLKDFVEFNDKGEISIKEGIVKLYETKLPIKTSYWLRKMIDKFLSEIKTFQELRLKLFKEYGEQKDPKKEVWSAKPENTIKLQEELTKLMDTEIEIAWTKLKIEDLQGVEIEAKHIVNWFFEDK